MVVFSPVGLKRYFHVVFLCLGFLVKNIEEKQMKKILILSLSAVLVLGIAGCQANQEATLTTQAADIQIATESQTEATSETSDAKTKSSEKTAESSKAETTETSAVTASMEVPGTWKSASVVEKEGEQAQPEFYVRFTRTEIQYGHMSAEGEFVNDRSDKITRLDMNIEGRFLIQAESTKAGKYTFKTSENDLGVMEYYTTWNEEEFADKYVGGSSISKCDQ